MSYPFGKPFNQPSPVFKNEESWHLENTLKNKNMNAENLLFRIMQSKIVQNILNCLPK